MTQTIIALLSIIAGILGANIFGKNHFDITGRTLAGVFGSIFFIKSLGRLGFNPNAIMQNGTTHLLLFVINMLVSFFGGVIAVKIALKIRGKMNQIDSEKHPKKSI